MTSAYGSVSDPPAEGAKADEKVRKAIVRALVKKSTDPGKRLHLDEVESPLALFSVFAENLAYDVSEQFGDKFKTWLGEDKNRNTGTEAKVGDKFNRSNGLKIQFVIHLCCIRNISRLQTYV